ncbi:COBRA-like protein 7 [Cornus florida]|uniref:COBRA-like protein 7 n=1 Tax=Cornus florida TaxID=4283 RepID=UPI0028A0AFAB|nr:COBRA-like protein 7 [Cornus florida]
MVASGQGADVTIIYNVLKAFETYYVAQVTITNHNPTHRIDNWRLKWDWTRQEFIHSIRGAYPTLMEQRGCIFGPQGSFYKDFDFSDVVNCQRTPEIADLPPDLANNPIKGSNPFCCRNGTILPPSIELGLSIAAFQLRVYKMPPDLNRSRIVPPMNWQLNGATYQHYQCGQPVLTEPDTLHESSIGTQMAVVSWTISCWKKRLEGLARRCCLSYSSFSSNMAIPCPTCACGCPSAHVQRCNSSASAVPVPWNALALPFEDRTKLKQSTPCGDNCGVSIHWHICSEYDNGWFGRITIFNWDSADIADWFVTMQMDQAASGIENVYSFNTTFLEGVNNTIFMHGLSGLNYIIGKKNGGKNSHIPGKQQTVIEFSRRRTPGINVLGGDGFPTKVTFNGEECSLPQTLPRFDDHGRIEGLLIALCCLFLVIVTGIISVRVLT